MKKIITAALVLVAAIFTGCSTTEDHSSHNASGVKPYPLKTCIVTDEAFDHGKPYTFVYKGQEIKMCCDGCRNDFDKEPETYLKKLGGK